MTDFSRTYSNFVNGTTADADQVDQNFADIQGFVNGGLVFRDGSKSMSGPLSLPTSDPISDQHAVRKGYMDGPYVHAHGTVLQTFVANTPKTIKFATVDRDSHSAYDQATGIFAGPRTGVYAVAWTHGPDQANDYLYRMQVVAGASTYEGPKYTPHTYNHLNEEAQACQTAFVYITEGQNIVPQASISASVDGRLGIDLTIAWLHG